MTDTATTPTATMSTSKKLLYVGGLLLIGLLAFAGFKHFHHHADAATTPVATVSAPAPKAVTVKHTTHKHHTVVLRSGPGCH